MADVSHPSSSTSFSATSYTGFSEQRPWWPLASQLPGDWVGGVSSWLMARMENKDSTPYSSPQMND